jgi:ABC-2 type transport system ATP-binding protein
LRYRFQLQAGDTDPGEAIAAAIVQAGFGLYELRRHQASLEDVFLNLTTEEPTAGPDKAVVTEGGDDADTASHAAMSAGASTADEPDDPGSPETDS